MLSEEEKYVFLAEWFQEEGLLHKFIMVFYPDDNSLELVSNYLFCKRFELNARILLLAPR